MDPQQDKRFRDAVERKKRESQVASHDGRHDARGEGGPIDGDQQTLRSPSRPQDTSSPRGKSSRHKKVTADKWNQ